jgi:hypothetical protein
VHHTKTPPLKMNKSFKDQCTKAETDRIVQATFKGAFGGILTPYTNIQKGTVSLAPRMTQK